MAEAIKFIDLFAGIGGMRKGFEIACKKQALPIFMTLNVSLPLKLNPTQLKS